MVNPSHAAGIIVVNNAALDADQSLGLKSFRVLDGRDRLLENMAVGPVEESCTNGCGSEPMSFAAENGVYRLELRSDTTPALTAVTFKVKKGEEFIWMVSNRATPPSHSLRLPGIEVLSDNAPFRLDLVTYSPAVDMPVQAAPQRKVKPKKPFWPFEPSTRRSPVND